MKVIVFYGAPLLSERSARRMLQPLALALACVVPTIPLESTWARTWHVRPDGTGDTPTIQAAIDAAAAGDTVALAAGTYSWTSQGSTGDAMLHLRSQLTLVGESGASSTVLDGELRGRVIRAIDAIDTEIDGLTVTRGLHRVATPFGYGGGLFSSGRSRLTISDCIFRENYAADGNRGGGVYCDDDGSSVLSSVIVGNAAPYGGGGGGIYMTGGLIAGCHIQANYVTGAGSAGGGIALFDGMIRDCTIEDNYARGLHWASGGGAIIGRSTVTRCVFVGNYAFVLDWGGGGGGGVRCLADATISNCVFLDNRAIGTGLAGWGGAVAGVSGARVVMERCTLVANRGETDTGSVLDGVGGVEADGTIRSTIIAWSTGLPCRGPIRFSCTDVFGNSSGDQLCGADDGGNFSADPLFCSDAPASSRDVTIRANSPCAPGGQPDPSCGLIGAGPVGCPTTRVDATSWSAVKGLYR